MTAQPRSPSSAVDPLTTWQAELEKLHPGVAVPNYWQNLEANTERWAGEVRASDFWRRVQSSLPEWRQTFHGKTGGALLADDGLPEFVGKGAQRIREKAFRDRKRRGVGIRDQELGVWEKHGPPVPHHDDLVRTRVPCTYLDAVVFFVERLRDTAATLNVPSEVKPRALAAGYHAQHFYFESDFLYRVAGSSEKVKLWCEVQVATVLATRIWSESHPVYEEGRHITDADDSWAWNPQDRRFLARQLGHTLHLADGILVQLRELNRRRKEPTDDT